MRLKIKAKTGTFFEVEKAMEEAAKACGIRGGTMDDLISRAAAIAKVEKARKAARTLTGMDFVIMLKDQPTVNAAPVVRCRDCKYWWSENELCTHYRHVDGGVCCHECNATDYCSDGERRDEDGNTYG